MNIVTEIKEWLEIRARLSDKKIGFIPTMGHLHQGHLSLCQRAKIENEIVVVSIFINPTQFDQEKDFNSYPRTLEKDVQLLQENKIDYLFYPDKQSLYPDEYSLQINEITISKILEGQYRPGHFNGMLTIVLKLLNLIQPQHAYVGEKDYQQFLLIRKMVASLFLSTQIILCDTLRAADGLALSSRNSRLNEGQRKMAAAFPTWLQSTLSDTEVREKLISLGFKVDYIATHWQRRLGAVWVDDIRLIDNVGLGE